MDLRAWDAYYRASVRDEMFGRPWAAAESAWLSGRDTFMKKFKPNVTSLVLLFSTADARAARNSLNEVLSTRATRDTTT